MLEKIGLLGSFARDEQTENSDIDLLVVYNQEAKNFYDLEIQLKKLITNQFNRKVDVYTEKWIRPIFKPMIMEKVLYA